MTEDEVDNLRSLYEVTGDIKDINTLLVNRADLQEIARDARVSKRVLEMVYQFPPPRVPVQTHLPNLLH